MTIKVLTINNLVLIACIVFNIYKYTLAYICNVVTTCFSCAILSQINRTTLKALFFKRAFLLNNFLTTLLNLAELF